MKESVQNTNPLDVYAIATGAAPVEGDLIAINSSKEALPAADTASLKVIGICAKVNVVNGVATTVEVRDGVYLVANSEDHPLDRDDRNSICYVEDKDTVSSDPGTHACIAGVVVDVYSDLVLVDTRPAAIAAVTGKNPVAAVVAAPAAITAANPAAITAANPAAITAAAANGGVTVDAEGRAEIAKLVTDLTASRAEVVKLVTDLTASRAEVVKTITDLTATRTAVTSILTALKNAGIMASS